MKLALLFPQFAPNLYDLAVMLQSDLVVFQDRESWSRKSRVHRAKIRTPGGTQWINIPVRTVDRKKAIHRVRINHDEDWVTPLLRSLEFNYRNSIYYDFYEPEIKADFENSGQYTYLLPFVLYIQKRLFTFMDITIDYRLSSEMDDYSPDPDRFAEKMKADTLFQEYDSRHYQRQADRRSEPEFEHPVYHQHFEGFEPYCCLLDLLFQYGPESFRVIDALDVRGKT